MNTHRSATDTRRSTPTSILSNRFNRMRLSKRRHGITLIELMIAVVISIVILGVLIRAFQVASSELSRARATLEMAAQMRSAGETLRNDLENVTVPIRPWATDSGSNGYFEIVEGPDRDNLENVNGSTDVNLANQIANATVAGASYLGDHDDIIAMTVRSKTRPFKGRWVNPATGNSETIESYVAEVVWWTVTNDTDGDGEVDYFDDISLYRRVLLIRPDLTTTSTTMNDFFQQNDVSARPQAGGILFNSLSDLTKRENRFAHNAATFPHAFMRPVLDIRPLTGTREGADVMLTNVAAFDIKVFSPNTGVTESTEQVIEPSDPNYAAAGSSENGAYVDLGDGENAPPNTAWFSGQPDSNSQLDSAIAGSLGNTWCTWSPHYEYDGVNQDSGEDSIVDQGTDGIDNNPGAPNGAGTDDDSERETKPPYENPIRAIQVSFRLIEKRTAQARQLTIRQSFVPE